MSVYLLKLCTLLGLGRWSCLQARSTASKLVVFYTDYDRTVVYREIETAVPDERILVLFVPYILLTRSYNIKVNIFGLNELKIEIDSPGAALCTCLVPNLYSLRYPKWYFVHYHYSNKFHYIFQIWCYIPDYTDIYYLEYGLHWLVQMQLNIFRCTNVQ